MSVSADLEISGGNALGPPNPNFALYVYARFFIITAVEMQSVAVGWQIYEITKRPFDLGLVGLAQFLPGLVFFLLVGHATDRFDRRKLLVLCYAGFGVCSGLLLEVTVSGAHSVYPIYAVLLLLGMVRSFNGTASRAFLPQLVPAAEFPKALALNMTASQSAMILGPAVGGLTYALFRGPAAVYAIAMAAAAGGGFSMWRVRTQTKPRPHEPLSLTAVLAGLRYIWIQKLILASISLDLFAVLLGGAVALLPVYARDILNTGPWGLGLLRSAPAVGAASMALLLAHRPLKGRTGAAMLGCVAGFGVFTIVFGLSRNLVLSLAALLLVGASDMVSVVIRGMLVQLATPDEMRGRVNAVDMVFVDASNQIGQFESGLTAAWFGTVPAVVLGGLGTLFVTILWAWRFPELRRAGQLTISRD